jgi:hypothetical protein
MSQVPPLIRHYVDTLNPTPKESPNERHESREL